MSVGVYVVVVVIVVIVVVVVASRGSSSGSVVVSRGSEPAAVSHFGVIQRELIIPGG